MAMSVEIRSRSAAGKLQTVIGKLVFSGTYPTGGESLPISSLAVGTSKKPIAAAIGGSSQHYLYRYDDGAQKVLVRAPGTPPTEHPAGAYNAAVTSDTVEFSFQFTKV
jgi:hypothetical protein